MARQTPTTTADTENKSDAPAKRKTGAFEFVQQVRQETAKVTWPTRKETVITTIMVVILAIVAAIFFFLVDQIAALIMRFVLGFGG